MLCHYCERDKGEGLPFRCNYCGESFCGEHRLPENHACPRVGGPLHPGYARIQQSPRSGSRKDENQYFPSIRSGRSRFRLRYAGLFSEVEKKHILLATAVMVAVGLSLSWSVDMLLFTAHSWLLLLLVPGFVVSFLGHEMAHKFLARRNGMWAEFRTNAYGLMMTIVSVLFPIKFLAPGQTNIQGTARSEIMGAIGLIGPGLNLALGFACLILSRLSASLLGIAFLELAMFNSWIAIFNLIPFGSLDGTMVFHWDKTRWAISFCAAVALTVFAYYPWII
ncbi:MAG TPA: AN1-type zinc finger domain-containing protein [Nitrososphaerales archaeon]|nr:AN1-type zinc finger domain-containing protein [Nitrososphaerales archaeon]